MSGTPPATASRDGATPFFTMVNSRRPAPHRAPRLDPAGWEQRLTSVPGRELLAPATGALNVQIWVFNAVIVIKPASMQTGGSLAPAARVLTTICDRRPRGRVIAA